MLHGSVAGKSRAAKSDIFPGKWHKKVAAAAKNIVRSWFSPAIVIGNAPNPLFNPISGAVSFRDSSIPRFQEHHMSSRSWFFAANNQQQGPYSDEQLRQFVSSGAVVADTFVWTEGMA